MVKLGRDAGAPQASTASPRHSATTRPPAAPRFSVHAHRRKTLVGGGGGRTSFNALAALHTDRPLASTTGSLVDITERIEDIIGKPVKKERAFTIPVIDRLSELKDHELNFGALALTFSAAVYEARVDNVGDKAHQALAIIGGGYAVNDSEDEDENGTPKDHAEQKDQVVRGRTKRSTAANKARGSRFDPARTLVPTSDSARITRTAVAASDPYDGHMPQQRDPFFAKTVKAVDSSGGDFLRIIPSRVTCTTTPLLCKRRNAARTGMHTPHEATQAELEGSSPPPSSCSSDGNLVPLRRHIAEREFAKNSAEADLESSADDSGESASPDPDNSAESTVALRKRAAYRIRPLTSGRRKSRRGTAVDASQPQPEPRYYVRQQHRTTEASSAAATYLQAAPAETCGISQAQEDAAGLSMDNGGIDVWGLSYVTSGQYPAFGTATGAATGAAASDAGNGDPSSVTGQSSVALEPLAGFLQQFATSEPKASVKCLDSDLIAQQQCSSWLASSSLCESIAALKAAMRSTPDVKQQPDVQHSPNSVSPDSPNGVLPASMDTYGRTQKDFSDSRPSDNDDTCPIPACEYAPQMPEKDIGLCDDFGGDMVGGGGDILGVVCSAASPAVGGALGAAHTGQYRLGMASPPAAFGAVYFHEGDDEAASQNNYFSEGSGRSSLQQAPAEDGMGAQAVLPTADGLHVHHRSPTSSVDNDGRSLQSRHGRHDAATAYPLPHAEMDLAMLAATIRKGRMAALAQKPRQQRRAKSPTAEVEMAAEPQLIMDFSTVSLNEGLIPPTEQEVAKAKRARERRAPLKTSTRGNLLWLTTEDHCVPTVAFKLHSILNFSLVQGITALPRLTLFPSHPYFDALGDGVRGSGATLHKPPVDECLSQGPILIGSPELIGPQTAMNRGEDTVLTAIEERTSSDDDCDEGVDRLIFNEHENLDDFRVIDRGDEQAQTASVRIKDEDANFDKLTQGADVPVYGIDFRYPFLKATKFVDVQKVKKAMKSILSHGDEAAATDVKSQLAEDDCTAFDHVETGERTLEELYYKTHTRIQDESLSFHRFFVLALHLCNETDSCILSVDQSECTRGNSIFGQTRSKKGVARLVELDAENALHVDATVMRFHAAPAFHF